MSADGNRICTWFAGLPAVEKVALTERDVARLRRLSSRRRATGWFLIFAFPSLLAVTVLVLLLNGWVIDRMDDGGTDSLKLGIVALGVMTSSLAFLLALPVSLLFAREAFRRARLARTAILRGELTRCRGRVEDLLVDRAVWKKLDAKGLLDRDEIEIDVAEDAEILWRVGPVEIEPWLEVRRGETTETPEYAWIASRWTRPTPVDQEAVHYNQRRLSDDEIAELADCIPRLGATRVAFVAALNLLALWRLAGWLVGGEAALEPFLVAALALWADIEVARLWARRHRFASDLAGGWVALVRMPEDKEAEGIGFAEFLPESGAEWTVDGAPAAWRRIIGHGSIVRGTR